jgi:guanine deaminase
MSGAEKFIDRAINLAINSARSGGGPFAALITKDGKVIAESANQVTSLNDPTAHAEMVVIRNSCAKLKTFTLAGCEIYSSCEPCPMCLAAIYWARLDGLFFAATRNDAAAAGFDDARIYREIAQPIAERSLPMRQISTNKAAAPFRAWQENPNKIIY